MKKNWSAITKFLFLFLLILGAIQLNGKSVKNFPNKLKTSLNAYSFNKPLTSGAMNLDQLIEFCATHQFDAVDLTGYYFPGYPEVPSDEYLYLIKHKAFVMGVEISGTGVRNDFTDPDPVKLKASIELVKKWIVAAEKMGAPVIRVFTGPADLRGLTRPEAVNILVSALTECVAYGKAHGVVVAIQNHHDFVKTAAETIEILDRVNSEWFGLILDIGSFRTDPYREIAQMIPYAVNWQLKENLYVAGKEQKTDLDRLMKIIQDSGYRGYLPIETLGEGDPKVKVPLFLKEVKDALGKIGQ
jgi:sugar phosphate isomerase/epimerase